MSSEAHLPWYLETLGLDGEAPSATEIKRAYARKLKAIDQAADPDGFQHLRAAYEMALALSKAGTAAEPVQDRAEVSAASAAPSGEDPRPLDPEAEAEAAAEPTSDAETTEPEEWPGLSPEEAAARDACNDVLDQFARETAPMRQLDLLLVLLEHADRLSIRDHMALEQVIVRYLASCIVQDGSGLPRFEPHILPVLLTRLGQMFQWQSDIKALERATQDYPQVRDAYFIGLQREPVDQSSPMASTVDMNAQTRIIGICVLTTFSCFLLTRALGDYPEIANIFRGIGAIGFGMIFLYIFFAGFRKLAGWAMASIGKLLRQIGLFNR